MQLLLDYPWYFVLLCLLAGAVYSFALYWKAERQQPRLRLVGMGLLRFLTVSTIAFLLLAPLVKRQANTHEKPIIVVAQDKSQSIRATDAGKTDPTDIILDQLGRRSQFEVVRDSFGDKTTDIAAALEEIGDRYAGRNLGAVILVSDGIYNQGANPATQAAALTTPVYTVALGDTTHRPDAHIAELRYNRIAYLGNRFPLEVTLHAHRLKGQRATLTVTHGDKRLYSKELLFTSNTFSTTDTLTLDANQPGLQRYTIALTPATEAAKPSSRTIAIEVIDGHQRIAILAAAPHPDVSALRQAIERNPNYQVEVLAQSEVHNQHYPDFSLLILHNLPDGRIQLPEAALRLPTIYVVGSQTDLNRFNSLHTGLEVVAKARKTDDVTPTSNRAFSLFHLDEEVARKLELMPPLASPFGTYRPSANLQSLFNAKIGNIASDRPLVAFCQQEGVRHAFIVGEGLWRWRLHDFQMTGSHDDFDQLIEKIVVYTSLQANKERLHITSRHIFRDNEPVLLEAELYDDNFETVNTPEVELELRSDSLPAARQYRFNRTTGGYALPLGTLPPAHYTYTASTTLAGRHYTTNGHFVVEDINLEMTNLVADHSLLNTIAQTTGAQMLLPDQIGQLPELLDARDDLKSIVYTHTRYTELLNLPLVLILLLLLLTAEWATRKIMNGNL